MILDPAAAHTQLTRNAGVRPSESPPDSVWRGAHEAWEVSHGSLASPYAVFTGSKASGPIQAALGKRDQLRSPSVKTLYLVILRSHSAAAHVYDGESKALPPFSALSTDNVPTTDARARARVRRVEFELASTIHRFLAHFHGTDVLHSSKVKRSGLRLPGLRCRGCCFSSTQHQHERSCQLEMPTIRECPGEPDRITKLKV